MNESEKLAEAMGWERKVDKLPQWNGGTCTGKNPYWLLTPDAECSLGLLRKHELQPYFDSPAGEKAVRDKVWELWCINGHHHVQVSYTIPGDNAVCLWLLTYAPPPRFPIEPPHTAAFSIRADTEPESYAAALIWLADRGN